MWKVGKYDLFCIFLKLLQILGTCKKPKSLLKNGSTLPFPRIELLQRKKMQMRLFSSRRKYLFSIMKISNEEKKLFYRKLRYHKLVLDNWDQSIGFYPLEKLKVEQISFHLTKCGFAWSEKLIQCFQKYFWHFSYLRDVKLKL